MGRVLQQDVSALNFSSTACKQQNISRLLFEVHENCIFLICYLLRPLQLLIFEPFYNCSVLAHLDDLNSVYVSICRHGRWLKKTSKVMTNHIFKETLDHSIVEVQFRTSRVGTLRSCRQRSVSSCSPFFSSVPIPKNSLLLLPGVLYFQNSPK